MLEVAEKQLNGRDSGVSHAVERVEGGREGGRVRRW